MSRESDPYSRIPVRGKRKRHNQEGLTLTSRPRVTEIEALQSPILSPALYENFDVRKADVILLRYHAARERGLRGMALVNWIASGHYLRSDVQRYLGELKARGSIK